jgi:hypothetical protein
MGLIDASLRDILGHGLITDSATQAKVITANHNYNLLCSAWADVMVGRYTVASSHWRSLLECPRYLLALEIKPELAESMMRGRLKVETVLRTIRNGFSSKLRIPATASWVQGMYQRIQRELTNTQKFAHIDIGSMSTGFNVTESFGKRVFHIEPGGALEMESLRIGSMYLSDAAILLASCMVLAFPADADHGMAEFSGTLADAKRLLEAEAHKAGIQVLA